MEVIYENFSKCHLKINTKGIVNNNMILKFDFELPCRFHSKQTCLKKPMEDSTKKIKMVEYINGGDI